MIQIIGLCFIIISGVVVIKKIIPMIKRGVSKSNQVNDDIYILITNIADGGQITNGIFDSMESAEVGKKELISFYDKKVNSKKPAKNQEEWQDWIDLIESIESIDIGEVKINTLLL